MSLPIRRTSWGTITHPDEPFVGERLDFPVYLEIRQNDVETGSDIGFLGFDGEALWFKGQESYFRLTSEDFDQRVSTAFAASTAPRRYQEEGIRLRFPARRVVLYFSIMEIEGRQAADDLTALNNLLDRFLESEPTDEPGPRCYPPLSVHSGVEFSDKGAKSVSIVMLLLAIAAFVVAILFRSLLYGAIGISLVALRARRGGEFSHLQTIHEEERRLEMSPARET